MIERVKVWLQFQHDKKRARKEAAEVRAYADNPFMDAQYRQVPRHYAGWFRHELIGIYEQLRAAGVETREVILDKSR